jgi:ABC-type cobalamin/Fe3+-siderophores transport system ATPase subunit
LVRGRRCATANRLRLDTRPVRQGTWLDAANLSSATRRLRRVAIAQELVAGGTAVVLVTHDRDHATEIADTLVFLAGGAIRQRGPTRGCSEGRPARSAPDVRRRVTALSDT